MKIRTKSSIVASFLVISTATFSGPAFASSQIPAGNIATAGAKDCTNLTARIDGQITKIATSIGKQTATYDKQDSKVAQLITRAKAASVDTSKAELDLNTWVAQTNQIKTLKTDLISELTNLKNLQCADQKTQYKQSLAGVKAKLVEIKDLQKAKKSFFATTLKVDLQQISISLRGN